MAALDWTNERVGRLRQHGSADAAQIDRLVPDVELALVSAQAIAALVRDFQLFLRPDEMTPVDRRRRGQARGRARAADGARAPRRR